ncbi:MAG: HD domain-containing protein [Faecalibacterium sp.]|nr:HD domain-containing protein [Faecalibacterium sp.]
MDHKSFLQILHLAERLKNNTRHSWTSTGRHESVAEHSWRLCLMAMLVRDEFPQADMDKVLQMCVLHDLGEAFTGDVPAFEKTAAHEQAEADQLRRWLGSLPAPYAQDWTALFDEMDALQTVEAKIYKALDNMEAVVQHNEAELSSWLPLEYDLQLRYGADKVTFSPWMQQLKDAVNAETREKVAREQPH